MLLNRYMRLAIPAGRFAFQGNLHVTSKLKAPPPLVARLAPIIASQSSDAGGRDNYRDRTQHWRRWYGLQRWKDLRWSILVRDLFTCQLCGHIEYDTSQLTCDHVEPHRGDWDRFWSGPFQTLCNQCHRIEKQSQEHGTAAKHHPDWLSPSGIPLTIVCGPPASGKSSYAAARASANDIVIDLDVIASGLSGQPLHTWDREQWLGLALRKRNAMLAYLGRKPRWKRAWFIVGEPKAKMRQWWHDRLKPNEIVVLAVAADECMRRAALDPSRDMTRTRVTVEAWWQDYAPRAGDTVIEQ